MLLLLAAAILHGPSITVASNSMHVGDLVAAIAKQSGMELKCEPNLSHQALIVDVHDVDANDFKTRLAGLIGAKWDHDKLTRSVGDEKLQSAEEQAKVSAIIDAQLQDFAKLDSVPKQLDRTEADKLLEVSGERKSNNFEVSTGNFMARAARRVVLGMGAKSLAAMPVGARWVFSDKPTPMQYAAPKGSSSVFNQLVSDTKLFWIASMEFDRLHPSVNGRNGNLPNTDNGLPSDGIGKCLIVIQRKSPVVFGYEVTVYSGKFEVIAKTQSEFSSLGSKQPPTAKEEDFELTSIQKTLCGLIVGVGAGEAGQVPYRDESGALKMAGYWIAQADVAQRDPVFEHRDIVADPVKYDPANEVFGPILRVIATRKSANILAILPDSMNMYLLKVYLSNGMIQNSKDVLDWLLDSATPETWRIPEISCDTDERWMIVKPFLPVYARETEIDRYDLKHLFDRMKAEGALRLTDAATYWKATKHIPTFRTLDFLSLIHVIPEVDTTAARMLFKPIFPILATLSPQQWTTALQGQLTFQNLTPQQQSDMKSWVYNTQDFRVAMRMAKQDEGTFEGNFSLEPTEVLPNGIPGNTVIRLTTDSAPMVIARSILGVCYPCDAVTLAGNELFTQDGTRVFADYRPAQKNLYKAEFSFMPSLLVPVETSEIVGVAGKSYGPRNQLSAEFLKKVDFVKQAIDAELKN